MHSGLLFLLAPRTAPAVVPPFPIDLGPDGKLVRAGRWAINPFHGT